MFIGTGTRRGCHAGPFTRAHSRTYVALAVVVDASVEGGITTGRKTASYSKINGTERQMISVATVPRDDASTRGKQCAME